MTLLAKSAPIHSATRATDSILPQSMTHAGLARPDSGPTPWPPIHSSFVERAELIPFRDQLRAEKTEVDAALAELQRRETSLATVIAGLDELIGDASADSHPEDKQERGTSSDYPRGSEAVRRVLQASTAKLTVRQITEELLRRGWTPRSKIPENATASAASRAAELFPEVHRERGLGGTYVYWHEPLPADEPVELEGQRQESTPITPSAPLQPPWVPQSVDVEGGDR